MKTLNRLAQILISKQSTSASVAIIIRIKSIELNKLQILLIALMKNILHFPRSSRSIII